MPTDVSEHLAEIRRQEKHLVNLHENGQLTDLEFFQRSSELSREMQYSIQQVHENNPGLFRDGESYIVSREYESDDSETEHDNKSQ